MSGGVYSVGYNAWKGEDGLSNMMDALESEGVSILVDTRNSDYRAKYSFDQLSNTARNREQPIRFAHRPELTGKPKAAWEFTEEGQADYSELDKRPEAQATLNGIAKAVEQGEKVALLCACKEVHTCHRSRWLGKSLEGRGIDVTHIEPGAYDAERDREQGERERYVLTRQADLGELPDHSETNWAERNADWQTQRSAKPPQDYQSPKATQPLPETPQRVLIAGSMNANNAMLNYTAALVERAAEIGAEIHVGDNDQGVDARVVATANALGYEKVVVWTAGEDPRNGGVEGGQVRKVPHNTRERGNRWTQRDRTMIRSLDPDQDAAFFIDNGFTHHKNGRMTGTEAGYSFAVEQGMATRKISLGRRRDREAELKPLPQPMEQSGPELEL